MKKKNVDDILNYSFHEIKNLALNNGYKNNVKDLHLILQNLEKKLIQDFFTENNPYSELSFEIKRDIIKFVKLKYLKEELHEYFKGKELIFQSLDVSIKCNQIPTNLYFLKTNYFLSNLSEFKNLNFLDICIKDIQKLRTLNKLKYLIGLKISLKNISNEVIDILNSFENLKFLYLIGENNSRKRLKLKNLKKLSLVNNNVKFSNINIKNFKIKNSNLDESYIKEMVELNHLLSLKLNNCILPKNFLEILDSKLKILNVKNCRGEFNLYPKKNFYIEKLHFENFKCSKDFSKKLCTLFKRGLKNIHKINFFFE